jgi:hypothetical protein
MTEKKHNFNPEVILWEEQTTPPSPDPASSEDDPHPYA